MPEATQARKVHLQDQEAIPPEGAFWDQEAIPPEGASWDQDRCVIWSRRLRLFLGCHALDGRLQDHVRVVESEFRFLSRLVCLVL